MEELINARRLRYYEEMRMLMYRLQNAYIQTPTTVIDITNADVQVEVRHDKLSMQFESGPVAC